ncbi:hypothetical protein EXU57_08415 [Segetibacter sp. 3557_3]|uniref:hypothetical protein n=1 Tax=Segetibacter sp. 3557_3 TaxID=2547429 RepID=UPI00105863FD|nr:hypothetical protein [Segetibacter sp. 3557_3]TDH26823.1 hypothetical protein EXU57_08415 [Segetibacter sp. 3557_3]
MKTIQLPTTISAQKRASYSTENPASFAFKGLMPAVNRKRKAVTPPAHVWDRIASALDQQDQHINRSTGHR